MKHTILLIIITLLVNNMLAQNFNKAKMDSLFTKIDQSNKGMGSISIFKNGNEIYQKSFGLANIENKTMANALTKYRIGSVSKSLTAVVIMQLIEKGQLSLQSKLSDYFPELPYASKITIEQLLRHRSGISDFTKSKDYVNWMTETKTKSELLTIIKNNGTDFEPNEKTQYSNTNYDLLAFIAEKIENKNFPDIIEEHITEPLKLKNTYYGCKIITKNNEASSYEKLQTWEKALETNSSLAVGSGAMVSNPYEINLFFYKLFKGEIVSKTSLKEMMKIVNNFGIGIMQSFFYNKEALGHNGSIDGFQTKAIYFLKDSISITYMTNAIDTPVDEILFGALSIYFDKNYTIPDFQPDIDSISTDIGQYQGIYKSKELPIDITITKEGISLKAQATGQPSFVLEPYALHKFKYEPWGLTMEFIPKNNRLILHQYGKVMTFTR